MAKKILNSKELNLLKEVVARRAPELLFIVARIEQGELPNNERNRLIDEVLAPEFITEGLQEDWEPNQYGLLIHRLIDALPIQEE